MIHSVLEIKSFCLPICIGKEVVERNKPQPINFSIKIAFLNNPLLPNNSKNNICYQQICDHIQSFVQNKQFVLIEQLAQNVWQELNKKLTPFIKLQVNVQKVHPPVDNLKGGVSYSFGDLF